MTSRKIKLIFKRVKFLLSPVMLYRKYKFYVTRYLFGNANKNIYFYIIRPHLRNVGLISYYTDVLGKVLYAIENNYIAVVDMKNFENTYLESFLLYKENAWEYYFSQPNTTFSLEQIYHSKNVIISDTTASPIASPRFLYFRYLLEPGKKEQIIHIANKYIPIHKNIRLQKECLEIQKYRILGVAVRGTDMINAKYHSKQPSFEEQVNKIRELISLYNLDKIFIASEEQKTIDKFISVFGNKIITDGYRKYDSYAKDVKNLADISFNRKYDKKLKGIEYLTTINMLASCTVLYGSIIGKTVAAIIFNNNYEHIEIYDNGVY